MNRYLILFFTQLHIGFIFFSYSSAEKIGIGRSKLIKKIIYQLHNEEYDSVFANSSLLMAEFPSRPEGYFLMANAYGTFMRDYRIRKYESEFNSMIDSTFLISERLLRNEEKYDIYFLRGAAEGYRSMHLYYTGERLKALGSIVNSIQDMSNSVNLNSDFVDPLLGLAQYQYAKLKVLRIFPFGMGSRYDDVIQTLDLVHEKSRYVKYSALYTLQLVYYDSGDYEDAFRTNERIFKLFSDNPACLYYRALLLEKLERYEEGLTVWKKLLRHIQEISLESNGYLAECYYHIYFLSEKLGEVESGRNSLEEAVKHMSLYKKGNEMQGPLFSVEEIRDSINKASR